MQGPAAKVGTKWAEMSTMWALVRRNYMLDVEYKFVSCTHKFRQ